MSIEQIILYGTIQEKIILASITVAVIIILFFYIRWAKRRWYITLNRSLDYHRFHLKMIMNENDTHEKTDEVSRAMLWAIEKQLPIDRQMGLGFKSFFKSYMGIKTCLMIMSEVFYQVARFHWDIDKRIPRLMMTLNSTFYRIYILESYFAVIALLYIDLKLILARAGIAGSGKAKMYRDMSKK